MARYTNKRDTRYLGMTEGLCTSIIYIKKGNSIYGIYYLKEIKLLLL